MGSIRLTGFSGRRRWALWGGIAVALSGCTAEATTDLEDDSLVPDRCGGCDAPARCIDGVCAIGCAVNADCEIGEACDEGRCVAAAMCSDDSECADGEVCLQGGCYEAPCEEGELRACSTACGDGQERCLDGEFVDCTAAEEGPQGCPPTFSPGVRRYHLNNSESAEAMLAVSDGLILAGRTDPGERSSEAWLIKVDADGLPVWQVMTEGPDYDTLAAVVQVGDDLAAFGQTKRRDGDIHDGLMQIHGPDGALKAARTIPQDGGNAFTAATLTESGRVVIAGRSTNDSAAVWAVGLDESLDIAWQRLYDGPGRDQGYAAAPRPGGGAIIVGITDGPGDDSTDALIMAVDDTDGRVLWRRNWGGTSSDLAWAVTTHEDVIYVAGHTRSQGAGETDAFVLALNPDGELLWQRTIGTAVTENVGAIATGPEGIYVGGRAKVPEDDIDVGWLFLVSFEGELIWERRVEIDGFLTSNSVVTVPGAVALTGFVSDGQTDLVLSVLSSDEPMNSGCQALSTPATSSVIATGPTLGDADLAEIPLAGQWVNISVTSQSTALETTLICTP